MAVDIDAIHFKKPPYKRLKTKKDKEVIKEKVRYKDAFGVEWLIVKNKDA